MQSSYNTASLLNLDKYKGRHQIPGTYIYLNYLLLGASIYL
ncbi:hypothetical protein BDA96_06G124600 [Sorghum bicolor]|uniref:Uncharacterized protein n=1 Tax=Sorghum bicolor TaxID=4558 RepID=A0A921UBR3_SORBI|nr:hypothetical protein BDA96_06G124600 [Sorghum bicolor]